MLSTYSMTSSYRRQAVHRLYMALEHVQRCVQRSSCMMLILQKKKREKKKNLVGPHWRRERANPSSREATGLPRAPISRRLSAALYAGGCTPALYPSSCVWCSRCNCRRTTQNPPRHGRGVCLRRETDLALGKQAEARCLHSSWYVLRSMVL